jgi:hypothetical protein
MNNTPQTANYQIEEVSGVEYQTLEQWQDWMLDALARLIADIFRQSQGVSLAQKCDTIEQKSPLEVNDV